MSQQLPFDTKNILESLTNVGQQLRRYGIFIFVLFIALLYGFVLSRIQTLNNTEPSADAVSSQVKAARVPHIDQSVIDQLKSLQDNSVNVQTLFEQARSNPFQ